MSQVVGRNLVLPDGAPQAVVEQWQASMFDGNAATILIQPLAIDESSRTMTVMVDVTLGTQLQSQLVDAATHHVIASAQQVAPSQGVIPGSTITIYSLKPQFINTSVTVHLFGSGAMASSSPATVFDVPMSDLFSIYGAHLDNAFGDASDPSSRIISGVPLSWNSSAYPADELYSYLQPSIDFPAGVVWYDQATGMQQPIQIVVAFERVFPDELSSREVTAQPIGLAQRITIGSPGGGPLVYGADSNTFYAVPPIMIAVTRTASDRNYLYAAACMPAFLGSILLLLYAWMPPNDKRRSHREVILGLIAVVIAVLPLRAVLVPQSVPDLTEIDHILALDLALLISLGAWIYWIEDLARARPPAGQSELSSQ